MQIKQLTNDEYNNFKKDFKNTSIYQTVEYAFVMNHQNFDSVIIGLVDDNNILAAGIVLIEKVRNNKFAYAPRGFIMDYTDLNLLQNFTVLLKKYLAKLGIVSIKMSPMIEKNIYDKKCNVKTNNEYFDIIFDNLKKAGYKHLGFNSSFEGIKPRFEAIIDLDKPYHLLFKDLNKEFRTKIRSAAKNGIQVFKGENLEYLYLHTKKKYPRDLNYFKDCYEYFSKNKSIEFYYTKLDTSEYLKNKNKELQEQEKIVSYYNENLTKNNKSITLKMDADKKYNSCKKQLINATKLLKEYPDGIITASALVIKNNDEVYLLMDGYDPKYKSLNAKHLLIWKLIENYSNQGFKKFNLGGMTDPNIESKFTGLNTFKLGFHSKVHEYIGDLELICNNTKYFVIKNSTLKGILKK